MSDKKSPRLTLDKEKTLSMEFPLDSEQIVAIRKCLENADLKVVVHEVDLTHGRGRDGWLYD